MFRYMEDKEDFTGRGDWDRRDRAGQTFQISVPWLSPDIIKPPTMLGQTGQRFYKKRIYYI